MKKLFKWIIGKSIRRQLIVGVAMVHLLLMSFFVYDLTNRQKEFLQEKANSDALFQTTILVLSSEEYLRTDDLIGLQEVLETFSQSRSIEYAMIVNKDGLVLSHTNKNKIGLFLQDSTSLALLRGTQKTKVLSSSEGNIEIAVPIIMNNALLGWALVSEDLTDNRSYIAYVNRKGILYTLAAILIGTLFAFGLSRVILRQLKLLLAGAERLGKQQLNIPIPIITDNEVGFVSKALNNTMLQIDQQNDSLRKSEEKYRILSENASDIIWAFDASLMKVCYFSPSIYPILGLTPEEAINLPLNQFFTPESLELVIKTILSYENLTDKSYSRIFNIQIFHKDGRKIDFEVNLSLILDNDGKLLQLQGISRDITEWKLLNQQLKNSELQYRSLAESSPDNIIRYDLNCKAIYANQRFNKQSATEHNSYINKTPLEFSPNIPITVDYQSKIEQVIKTGIKDNIVITIPNSEGELRIYNIIFVAERDIEDNIIGALAFGRDITEIRQAEVALLKSENDLKEAQHLAKIGSWDWDAVTDTITWSEEYYHIYGFDPTQPPPGYEEHLKVYTPESIKRLDEAVKKNMQTGEPYELDLEIEITDGTKRWITARSQTKYDNSGKVIGLFGTAQDITERKQSERSIALMNFALNNVHEAAFLIDENSQFQFVNDESCRIMGYTRVELLGMGVSDIDPDLPFERWSYHWSDLKMQGSLIFEGRHMTKEGHIFPVEINANYFEYDNQGYNMVLVRNITERKLAEDALRESDERYRKAQAIGHVGNWEYNLQTTLFWGSDEAKKIYGFNITNDAFTTEEVEKCIMERERVHQALIDLIKYNKPYDLEFDIITKYTGIRKTIISIANLERNEIGNPIKITGIIADITERKQVEKEIRRMNRALRMLSDSNQALIHSNDEFSLLDEICRIGVGVGSYSLVWIGFKEYNEAQTIRPIAYAGVDSKDYIESLNLTYADTERGRGPAGTAVRTGELCLIRDIQSEFFTPWRDLAIQKGYKTIICLPLKIEGSTFGVLAIYSNEVDIFDNKEVDILKELSADLAFGIRSLRIKIERDLAEKSLRYSEFVTSVMNQISNAFLKYSNDEIYSKVLDIIMRIINCDFGLFGYIDPNFDLIIPTMTKNIWDKCKIENKSVVFPKNTWGDSIWGRSIKEKVTMFSSGPFHTPEGHVSINNFISIPIVFNDNTIGLISLANSVDDFTEENINLLKNISNYISPILQARLQRDEQDKKRIIAEEEILKLSKGIEQSPLSIMITDKVGLLEYVNPKFCELTGYDKSEVIGKNPRILKSNYNNLIDYKLLWETIISGKVWNGEFYNKKKNGENYWESASIAPIFNSSKEITHFIAVKEDITEKKKMIDELVSSKEKAEESDRLKSAFLANMSHEIRTPINGIIGFSKILSEPDLTEDERIEFNIILKKSCQRLLNTVNDIIDLSKIEVGQMEVRNKMFQIGKLINELYEFHIANFKKKNIEFGYHIDSELINIRIYSDEQKIYQVLNNLLNNSYKFTLKGKVEFGCKLKNDYLKFYVSDTGIGISEDRVEFIFGRFNQENISLSREYEGSGLGLPISKGLLKLLGGEIKVQSEKGIGSTFTFTIPLVITNELNQISNINISKKIENLVLNNKVILIVEDDDANFILLRRLMEKETKTTVLHSENGFEAIEIVKKHPEIALIIMDIKMPVIDGYEATQKIRELNINIPIIAVTAFALAGDREKALAAGCDEYLSKPYDTQIFIKLIEKYLK